jgi:ribosome-associated translation inhibitor RaiA
MQLPLQVTFHGLSASESVEREVQERLADLEKSFPRIISCRVSIELPHRHHQQGRQYRVLVNLGVPGFHAVAAHPEDQNAEHEDVHLAIRDAFRAVRRQLEEHAGRRDAPGAGQTT